MNRDILPNLRQNYESPILTRDQLRADPVEQFLAWFDDALAANVEEPNAMTLATANAEGRPSARVVLLKDVRPEGFVFYTNYGSRKARHLLENPFASLVFLWLKLHRQVRVEGRVEKIPREWSEKYFQSRPKESQIGAWASPQSEVIESRDVLEKRVAELSEKYRDAPALPLPDNWGGFIVYPEEIEFWQGQPSRLHDRFRYTKTPGGNWQIDRLAP
ncbi:MAG: pyridoxamine 5'-phosphate oxidase [Bacteroidetes bacterium]|nr:MAG: pyridoxamine 5'-phosphate oxidase [Bacteroidota bacterium]